MTLAIKGKYVDFITNYIAQSPYGTPIFTAEVTERVMEEFGLEETQARKIVNTNLNRLNGVVLESFRKGIYYKPKTTAFGKSHLNPDQVVKKMYVSPKENVRVGYETGASLQHRLGLTTQMPKYNFIATNVAAPKVVKELHIVLRKPRMEVNIDNYLYLQILDAIENKDQVVWDAPHPEGIINKFIEANKLDYGKLLGYAAMNYAKDIVWRLGKVAEGTRL